MVTHVLKRGGRIEPFAESKLHDSLHAALLGVRALEGEALLLARRASDDVWAWLAGKPEVTSRDLHAAAMSALIPLHAEAAYAYDTHDAIL